MKTKNIVIIALAAALLTACKDKTYKPPTLDAMRSADKARAAWAIEADGHSVIMETQMNANPTDSIVEDSVSTSYSRDTNKSSDVGNPHSSINETEE